MSGFTESGFERKLAELNSTQVSIQTLSLWLIHHRKHYPTIVKTWYKEFLKAQEHRKLTFIYLANDVIQNGKKKGAEFCKGFAPVLKKALEYMARNPDDKIKKSILRILRIWEERGVYEPTLIKEFESTYRKTWDDLHGPDVDELLEEAIESRGKKGEKKDKDKDKEDRKRRHHHHAKSKEHEKKAKASKKSKEASASASASSGSGGSQSQHKHQSQGYSTSSGNAGEAESGPSASTSASKSVDEGDGHPPDVKDGGAGGGARKSKSREMDVNSLRKRVLEREEERTNTIEEWEVDGVTQLEIKLSPSPYKEPPTEEELIAFVKSLEKMPSTDAVTRGKIAHLPPEVSDPTGVNAMCTDSDATRELQTKIKGALDLLTEYNQRLDGELQERKTVSMKLQDLISFQKDLLTQAEHRLEEHQQYTKILNKKLDDMKAHVQSMPDLSKLPSVTDGLAPLPSAGDLFNI